MTGNAFPPSWMPAAAGSAPPRAAQRLVAVPWRHPGLILLCTLAGAGVAAAVSLRPAPRPVVGASVPAPFQAWPPAPASQPSAGQGLLGLRLDLDLDPEQAGAADDAAAQAGDTAMADAAQAPPSQPDGAHDDDIDALLDRAPPAAGPFAAATPAQPATASDPRGRALLPGLVTGLLLGLLAAALRELRGQRMRSPREAERALGAPVLGAIPTLSARARVALLAPRERR